MKSIEDRKKDIPPLLSPPPQLMMLLGSIEGRANTACYRIASFRAGKGRKRGRETGSVREEGERRPAGGGGEGGGRDRVFENRRRSLCDSRGGRLWEQRRRKAAAGNKTNQKQKKRSQPDQTRAAYLSPWFGALFLLSWYFLLLFHSDVSYLVYTDSEEACNLPRAGCGLQTSKNSFLGGQEYFSSATRDKIIFRPCFCVILVRKNNFHVCCYFVFWSGFRTKCLICDQNASVNLRRKQKVLLYYLETYTRTKK